jgi:hypothetical protein
VAAVRAKAQSVGDEPDSSIADWAEWALSVAVEIDPVGQRVAPVG